MKSRLLHDFPIQLCTKLNDLKFEIPNNFWGGAHRASSPDPCPLFLERRSRFGPYVIKIVPPKVVNWRHCKRSARDAEGALKGPPGKCSQYDP